MISDKQLLELESKAKKYGAMKLAPVDVDDFVQECLIRAWSSDTFINFSYVYKDFLAKKYGDRRLKNKRPELISLDTSGPEGSSIQNLIADERDSKDIFNIWDDAIRLYGAFLTINELLYLKMIKTGHNQVEIAKKLLISEGRASQIKREILKKCEDAKIAKQA